MAHRKPHGGVSKHHLTLGAGGILAAVALISAVALGMSQAQEYHPMEGAYTAPAPTYIAPAPTPAPIPAPYVAPTDPAAAPYVAPAGSTAPAPYVVPAGSTAPAPGTTQPPPGGCTAPSYWNGTSCASGQMQTPGTYPTGTQPMTDCGPNVYPTEQNPCRMTTGGSQPGTYGDPSQHQGQQSQYPGMNMNQGSTCGSPPFCPFGFTSTSPAGGNGCNSYTCNEPPAGFGDFKNFQQPMTPGFYSGYQGGHEGGEGGMNGSMGQFMDPFYSQHSGEQDFSKYQFQFNEEDIGRYEQEFAQQSKREITQNVRQNIQDSRQLKEEAKQITQQLSRIAKRSGVYCPAVAEYEAALSTINTAVSVLENTTADNLATAQATRDQVYGSQDNPGSGVINRLHGYFDQDSGEFVQGADLGSCEAAGHSFRELDRLLEDIARAIKQAGKKDVDVSGLVALQAEIEAFKASPPADFFAQPDPNECGFGGGQGGGGFGPMPFNGGGFGGFSGGFEMSEEQKEMFEQFQSQFQGSVTQEVAQRGMQDFMPSEEELACMPGFARYMMQFHQKFGELMQNLHEGFESGNICGQIDQMIEMSDQFVDDSSYEEGISILTAGKAACEAGDLEKARKALFKMQRIGGGDDGDEGFGFDAEDALDEKLAELVNKEVAKQVQAILGENAKIIAALEEQVAQLTATLASLVDFTQASEDTYNQFVQLPNKEVILDPVEDVLNVFDDQLEKLSEEAADVVKKDTEDFLNDLIVWAPTEEVADVIAQEADATFTEIGSLDVEEEDYEENVEALWDEFVENSETLVASVTGEDRIESGQTCFTDVAEHFEDASQQWFYSVGENGCEAGIVKGDINGALDAGKEMNVAEFAAMVVNGFDLEPVDGATTVSGVNLGSATWAAPYLAALDRELREEGTSVAEVLDIDSATASISRIDVAEFIAHIAQLPEGTEVQGDVSLSGASADELAAAAAAFGAGIITGGNYDGTLRKGEGTAVLLRVLEQQ